MALLDRLGQRLFGSLQRQTEQMLKEQQKQIEQQFKEQQRQTETQFERIIKAQEQESKKREQALQNEIDKLKKELGETKAQLAQAKAGGGDTSKPKKQPIPKPKALNTTPAKKIFRHAHEILKDYADVLGGTIATRINTILDLQNEITKIPIYNDIMEYVENEWLKALEDEYDAYVPRSGSMDVEGTYKMADIITSCLDDIYYKFFDK